MKETFKLPHGLDLFLCHFELVDINSIDVGFTARGVVIFAEKIVSTAIPAFLHEKLEVLSPQLV
jgi:hypothetical protein